MSGEETIAVVPMKLLDSAKSRLATVVGAEERRRLSLTMLERVLRAALESPVADLWVIGGGSDVKKLSVRLGAAWRAETGPDLNGSLWSAFQDAFTAGAAPVYLPADLPFVRVDDIAALLEASGHGESLTLAPASRDGGTNAIVVPAGLPFRPALGVESYRRHREQAAELDTQLRVHESRGLGLDLDTPEDLEAFEEMEPGFLRSLLEAAGWP